MRTHLVIPDTQCRPGVAINHLQWVGRYIKEKRPDCIIHLGDHADMPSLSSYDRGKRSFEGRRYNKDIAAARKGWAAMCDAMDTRGYKPLRHIHVGNHEERIVRATEADPILHETIGVVDLGYEASGWTVFNYLEPAEVDGVRYCHLFPRGASGRVVQTKRGAPNARVQLQREMQSCTAGHLQGLDFAIHQTSRRVYGIIAGSCYLHDEEYLSTQGNSYWRGIVVKHEVARGEYDPMFVSLAYLCRRYEGMPLDKFLRSKRVVLA